MATAAFRFSSPMLQKPDDAVMHECPVGYVIREAPYVYDVLDAASTMEHCTPTERARLSPYFLNASRVVASERARLRELKDQQKKAGRDAKYGERILKQRAGR